MRHTLVDYVDREKKKSKIRAAAASPMAKHVASHLQDPVGSTKESMDDLNQKRMDYEMAKNSAVAQLAPVKSVIDHIEQTHGLNPDEQLGYQDPNDPMGMMQPGGMPNSPQRQGFGMPPTNSPQDMNQQPGRMQQNNPAQPKTNPGTGPALYPGKANQNPAGKLPPKMNQNFPGNSRQGQAAMPGGARENNGQVNPPAAKPKGAGSMGRGSAPKNAAKAKDKADMPSRGVKVTVHADQLKSPGAKRNLAYYAGRTEFTKVYAKPFSKKKVKAAFGNNTRVGGNLDSRGRL